ncbi:hypothetical protein BBBOND_0310670 [Babesia bigemina]|uniref:Uncharacterized protein n=1 Tax=Babesia bigemina TaxID=5866 RepID=A0A061DD76_BABBI|nr:hypothetical protein BBBOND_0310670 [Babesia bigemina]CDR97164.1 hypothetical protein BBBOND_0310670 [Babesia bigemina]|eukprot:XP_012769350.1 hypothetical protein BBBOND_0310670 [Babesia bigemina]
MVSFKNRFMSVNSWVQGNQHAKLRRQLDRLHRQIAKEIKLRVKVARNELAQCDYSRVLSNAKNALVTYSTAIINGATRGTESVSVTGSVDHKSLAKQKVLCSQSEKKSRSSTFKKEESEFNNFINGLIRRVDKCAEVHRKADTYDEDILDALCATK